MPKPRHEPETVPPLYAMVQPGLEQLAAEEIEQRLGGDVRKTGRGLVVFRVSEIDEDVLSLRTTEDVFLLAWGSDELTYRAADLELIRRWTSRGPDWNALLKIHHRLRPLKGKPTYHLVTQMTGEHGYRRADARKVLARGLVGKIPETWREADEDAWVEVWLTIQGNKAVCGLRLSDSTMRQRTWKREHLPASLRPTVAAAMVRLSETKPNHVVLDPMCGAGTILAEQHLAAPPYRAGPIRVLGGDISTNALHAAVTNLRRLGQTLLLRWDAARLPVASRSVDRILSNPPFGKQLSTPEEVGPMYQRVLPEYDRVLKPGGRAVLLASEQELLDEAAVEAGWKRERVVRVRVLGQPAVISVWRKPV
jgi:tRNA (guanine6-N2)-methyltransferase